MKFRSLHIAFLLFSLPLTALTLLAQQEETLSWEEARQQAEESYGPDPDLLNGKKYNDVYRTAEGTPFFEVHGDMLSTIRIKGKIYQDQNLRFDIYNQLLILDFTDLSGARGSIVLRDDWVEFFTLGELLFRKYPDKDGTVRFGQEIHEGEYTCVYFWEKDYLPELKDGEKYFRFSEPDRDAVIIREGVATAFKSKGSFLKCFPKEERGPIKAFLREEGIRVQKASDPEMDYLMLSINEDRL